MLIRDNVYIPYSLSMLNVRKKRKVEHFIKEIVEKGFAQLPYRLITTRYYHVNL